VVFAANHLTDTDKQNSTGKYTNEIQLKKQIGDLQYDNLIPYHRILLNQLWTQAHHCRD